MASAKASSRSGSGFSLQFVALSFLLPYLVGYLISTVHMEYVETVLGDNPIWKSLFSSSQTQRKLQEGDPQALAETVARCYRTNFQQHVQNAAKKGIPASFVVHRNGQAESCGSTAAGDEFATSLQVAITDYMRDNDGKCPPATKYEVESLLTRYFASSFADESSCASEESYRKPSLGFYGYCDMGTEHTPILRDHHKLVKTKGNDYLPCHFHDAQGMRVTSLRQLLASPRADCADAEESCDDAVHLYAVPAGRVFLHVASYVGQRYVRKWQREE